MGKYAATTSSRRYKNRQRYISLLLLAVVAYASMTYISFLTGAHSVVYHVKNVVCVLLLTVAIIILYALQELNRAKYKNSTNVLAVMYRSVTTITLFVAVVVWLKPGTTIVGVFYLLSLIVYFEPLIKPYQD
jgi:chromate transport protein ChrA